MQITRPNTATANTTPLAFPARGGWRFSGIAAALVAMVVVGAGYVYLAWHTRPTPSSPLGLWLGSVGLVMMLGAQFLYTLRKRLPHFTLGRMRAWLESHIFLGLVGAFLVLLHAAGRFQGVAAAAEAVMIVMIASGFVGRYVYTSAPRTIDGLEIDRNELLRRFALAERRLAEQGVEIPPAHLAGLSLSARVPGWVAVFGRPWLLWRQRRRARRVVHRLTGTSRTPSALHLVGLLGERYELQLDLRSIAAARRWLAWWYFLHVPLGAVLFTLAAIHVVAALYYLD